MMDWLRLVAVTYLLPAGIALATVVVTTIVNVPILRGILRARVDEYEIVMLSLGIVGPVLFATTFVAAYLGLLLYRSRSGEWTFPFWVATALAVLVYVAGLAWIWTKRIQG